ncbi:hypothetical protein CEXT_71261 [Caerostris extrusa]|uniref:Uncharacterized protein n=1 Tax=Caerostris extrusa TaxID=172846 RepID=A0AAV4U595_CAEEX|nr:hypothetical protein CEXT_71261 [Caerostris extrusa]
MPDIPLYGFRFRYFPALVLSPQIHEYIFEYGTNFCWCDRSLRSSHYLSSCEDKTHAGIICKKEGIQLGLSVLDDGI